MRTIRTKVYQFSELSKAAKEKSIGVIITYSFPGLKLISNGGSDEAKIIGISSKGSNVMIEDITIHPGEYKRYKHWISADQITSEFKADGTRF